MPPDPPKVTPPLALVCHPHTYFKPCYGTVYSPTTKQEDGNWIVITLVNSESIFSFNGVRLYEGGFFSLFCAMVGAEV